MSDYEFSMYASPDAEVADVNTLTHPPVIEQDCDGWRVSTRRGNGTLSLDSVEVVQGVLPLANARSVIATRTTVYVVPSTLLDAGKNPNYHPEPVPTPTPPAKVAPIITREAIELYDAWFQLGYQRAMQEVREGICESEQRFEQEAAA